MQTRPTPLSLPFPADQSLRVAQLSPGPKFAEVKPVVLRQWSYVRSYAPNVVIGFTNELQHLAEVSVLGALDTSSIDHAVVAITRYGRKPLTDLMRVTLWQAFGVPIFELYVGLDYSLLAFECQAHDGWHAAPGVGVGVLENDEVVIQGAGNSGLRTGLRASLDRSPCPCGDSSLRLLEIEELPRPHGLCLAVSA